MLKRIKFIISIPFKIIEGIYDDYSKMDEEARNLFVMRNSRMFFLLLGLAFLIHWTNLEASQNYRLQDKIFTIHSERDSLKTVINDLRFKITLDSIHTVCDGRIQEPNK